jgi:uncharacterized damage-inducible protein DinB
VLGDGGVTEASRITDQLERAFDGKAWHGPPLMALLDGVDARAAAARPVPGAHTIWELVLHITTWMTIARRRLAGEAVEAAPDEDWPPMRSDAGEAGWRAALDALRAAHRSLVAAAARADDALLAAQTPGRDYTNYVLLHGVVQHTLYHAGQIALLKRAATGATGGVR